MTGFFTISDAARHIQDGTLDLLKFKTNPYRNTDNVITGSGTGQFQAFRTEFRCTLNLLAYPSRAPKCDL